MDLFNTVKAVDLSIDLFSISYPSLDLFMDKATCSSTGAGGAAALADHDGRCCSG